MPADRVPKPQTAKARAAVRRLQKEIIYFTLANLGFTAGELRERFAGEDDRRHAGAAFKALVSAGVLVPVEYGAPTRGPKRWLAVEDKVRELAVELRAAERAG